MRTRKVSASDELRPEYDLATLKGGVRGKYFKRATSGSNVVLLDPDVAGAFPTDKAVNSALRALLVAGAQGKPTRKARN